MDLAEMLSLFHSTGKVKGAMSRLSCCCRLVDKREIPIRSYHLILGIDPEFNK